jgi:DNA-binding NarL/FixJ family response regulator
MRVFIVEDSQALRERLNRTISSIPRIEVIGFADNARDALERIPKAKPDAVVLDIRLNESSGFEVLSVLKSQMPSPTVIVLTNYPYPQYRARYMQAGADYFFDKSTEIDQVVRVLQSLLHQPANAPSTKSSVGFDKFAQRSF